MEWARETAMTTTRGTAVGSEWKTAVERRRETAVDTTRKASTEAGKTDATAPPEALDDPAFFDRLAERALRDEPPTPEEAEAVLRAPDEALLSLLDAAYRVRRHFYGKRVRLNMIINAKSGLCPEDCAYCAQSAVSTAKIAKYPLVDAETLIAGAERAKALGAGTYCIVASGRGPTPAELARLADAVREIKRRTGLTVCTSLGILTEEKAKLLKAAGVDRVNHNLNTAEGHYPTIATTHTYADRVATVERVKAAGLSPCSGFIIGMGESIREIVDMAFAARALDVDSIPLNFLHPVPGTPLGDRPFVEPRFALKVVALFRFVNPTKEIRVAGGREETFRSLQPLLLFAANSIFIGDYLTTPGQKPEADRAMIEDLGFELDRPPEP
ncbi:biotin synthase BioB [Hydrogenibacillus schlegelii]|uniref:biotin synthase BioB n=1 Tax=Hydrogenibacillus schlegelii TaxID=1484 RepID=UPI00235258D9|nr:biotin synthase BioB [Hydrogenibacillus schlegelii]